MSQLTTHVLDTSIGKPAEGIQVVLESKVEGNWVKLSEGITNQDGRILNLLPTETFPDPGVYRLTFNSDAYFHYRQVSSFYPVITIEFVIRDQTHYHVPLLLSPFGYSTYRGS